MFLPDLLAHLPQGTPAFLDIRFLQQAWFLLSRNSFVVDEKRRIPTAVEVLDEITRTLPDDTWLLQLVFRDGTLRISGYSENPSALIRLLEQSALLTEVRFSSPVTMDPRLGRERFNIITVISDKEAT
jgi:general secretion pathway protein L